jgi:hypothetical protein
MYAYTRRFGNDYAEKTLRTIMVIGNATVNITSAAPSPPILSNDIVAWSSHLSSTIANMTQQ